jgi:hypothetical protein
MLFIFIETICGEIPPLPVTAHEAWKLLLSIVASVPLATRSPSFLVLAFTAHYAKGLLGSRPQRRVLTITL